jgi:release factor glutamine methyltransferase
MALGLLATSNPSTIASALRAWSKKFRACGSESPELDARILVGHALHLDRAALAADEARGLTADEEEAIATLARRRLAREPVARILGWKEFWSLPFRIDATTLVPRPETETIVEAALAEIGTAHLRSQPLRLADLGTGCGAILLALLSELPRAFGVGTDVSIAALQTAAANARRLGLTRARFAACDTAAALSGTFDLVVSDPPYIPSGDIASLAPEVRDFDPRQALDGGPDGLAFYRVIATVAPVLLAPGGILIVELGIGQAQAVGAMFVRAGLVLRQFRCDLNGVPRALVAAKMA